MATCPTSGQLQQNYLQPIHRTNVEPSCKKLFLCGSETLVYASEPRQDVQPTQWAITKATRPAVHHLTRHNRSRPNKGGEEERDAIGAGETEPSYRESLRGDACACWAHERRWPGPETARCVGHRGGGELHHGHLHPHLTDKGTWQ